MPSYRDTFKLDVDDIDLIEHALREHAAGAQARGRDGAAGDRARSVQTLLGKLHAQKIFYSHAGRGRAPNG